jgi:hypothetical protein
MALYDPYTGYTDDLIPTMTSNTAPSGTASASTADSTTYAAWKAMDKGNTTYWRSTSAGKLNCWLQYEFASSKKITKYTLKSYTTVNYAPKAWTFEAYNGSTWVVLDTQTGKTTWDANVKQEFTFTNTTAYTKYRIYITEQNGGTYTGISEIEMMETVPQVTKVNVASVNLQTEITAKKVNVSSLNLQTELHIPKAKISSLNLQVEVVEGASATSRYKKWDGSAWTTYPVKKWSASAFADVSSDTKWYDVGWQS